MLGMFPEHVAEQKRLTEQLMQDVSACGDNFKRAKQLVKEQLMLDAEEQYGGVLGNDTKYKFYVMMQDNELVPHLQSRVEMWTAKLKVASQRAERDLKELQRRMNDTEVMIAQIDSDDPRHALNPPQAEEPRHES